MPADGPAPETGVPAEVDPVLFAQDGAAAFALMDGARVTGLAERLGASKLAHACLFNGQAHDDFADVAPWIAQVSRGNRFVEHLFTPDQGGTVPWGGLLH